MNFKSSAIAAALTTLAVVAAAPRAARADRRAFGYTYEYNTMPEGGLDLELWNTQARARFPEGPASFEWKLEVEYGITDHWDLAVYQTFGQDHVAGQSDALQYRETSVESRYRLAERGEWPVDVLLYLEVAKGFGTGLGDVEPKLILAKDVGALSLNLNLIPEVELTRDADGKAGVELVPGFAFGGAYEINPSWKVGAETFGEIEDDNTLVSVGPSVSWAPSEKLWIAGTLAAGVTDASDAITGRFVIGLGL
jgi:hypothetical protein